MELSDNQTEHRCKCCGAIGECSQNCAVKKEIEYYESLKAYNLLDYITIVMIIFMGLIPVVLLLLLYAEIFLLVGGVITLVTGIVLFIMGSRMDSQGWFGLLWFSLLLIVVGMGMMSSAW